MTLQPERFDDICGFKRTSHDHTVSWMRAFRWHRRINVHRHRSAASSDRWVFQTSTVYDRRHR